MHLKINICPKDPLIIIGNGPSAKNLNIDLIRNCDTWGFKGAYRLYPSLNWYPKFWSAFDTPWIENPCRLGEVNELIKSKKIEHVVLFDNPLWSKFDDIIKIKPYYYPQPVDEFQMRPYDIREFHYRGGPSTYIACQLAPLFGYRKIILIGVDCNYSENVKYFDDDIHDKNDLYFNEDFDGLSDIMHEGNNVYNYINDMHIEMFRDFRSYYPDIDVVNCGKGSNLKMFRTGRLEDEI